MKRLLIAAVLAVAAAASSAPAAAASGATVKTAKSRFGTILIDRHGRTLYLFKKDTRGHSACAGACAGFWPPLLTHGRPHAAGGARASRLGSISRGDGTRQVTYRGHPLYRFSGDHAARQTNGEGLAAFGASWYVVSRAGRAVVG